MEDFGEVSFSHLINLAGYDSVAGSLSDAEFSEGVFRVPDLLSLNRGKKSLIWGADPEGLLLCLAKVLLEQVREMTYPRSRLVWQSTLLRVLGSKL